MAKQLTDADWEAISLSLYSVMHEPLDYYLGISRNPHVLAKDFADLLVSAARSQESSARLADGFFGGKS